MDAPPADPQRVAARAVGRTPEEHAALERALARRRARRAARSQQQERFHERLQEPPAPRQSSNGSRIATTTQLQSTPEEGERSHWRQLLGIGGYERFMDHMERVRQSCLRREKKHWRKRGVEIWDLDPLMRPIPKPTGQRAFDLPYHEARADKYEATEPQAELTETRRQIRAEPGLSHQCKVVLILVTQIPRGRWTTYATIHVHLLEMGYFCLEGQIGDVLAENTLGGAVPCHRVIAKCGFLGRPMDLGRHCGNHEEVVELLSEEGVNFRADGSLTDDAFRDFVGCPRV